MKGVQPIATGYGYLRMLIRFPQVYAVVVSLLPRVNYSYHEKTTARAPNKTMPFSELFGPDDALQTAELTMTVGNCKPACDLRFSKIGASVTTVTTHQHKQQ